MLDVTVKRSEWARGFRDLGTISMLYNPETKKRCCLGFAGNAARISDEQMGGMCSPATLKSITGLSILDSLLLKSTFLEINSTVCYKLMSINDSIDISEEERESRLIELGKEVGINFTFVD